MPARNCSCRRGIRLRDKANSLQIADRTIVARAVAPQVLDLLERLAVAALYAYFVYNIGSDVIARYAPFSAVLLVSESLILVFTLVRQPVIEMTARPLDWALGVAGTTVPLLVLPGGPALIALPLILVVMIGGAALQITAKLFLRRSFGIVAANRGVKAAGPYHIIRHPIYAGYILTELGFLLGNLTARNLVVYSVGWACQIGRIFAEERLLLRDEAYRTMVERVPYRLIPKIF